jgi:hypothetical protein
LNNLADDPNYQDIKQDLLEQLNDWCGKVILDKGVSEEFRQGGWPSTYPTKTLEEWEATLELFKPWVFRAPGQEMKHPFYP